MASLKFTWNDEYNDRPEITYNLYENNEKIVTDIAQLMFSLLMDGKDEGEYSYYVTAYDNLTKLESPPSNIISVNFTVPAAPTGLSVGWE